MKNIFKFMGVALVACSLMVACVKEEEENNDTTPVNPTPTSSVTVIWDGVQQDLGFKDAYRSSEYESLFWFEAAKGMDGQNLVFPAFYLPFWLGQSGDFYPAFLYTFSDRAGNEFSGNELFPTEVYNEGGLEVTFDDETYVIGDYQYYTHNYSALPEVVFDATTMNLSINVPVTMYDYAEYDANHNIVQKVLDVTFDNYHFDSKK